MKPDKSGGIEKNYQPVVIKTLNQSEGIAWHDETFPADRSGDRYYFTK